MKKTSSSWEEKKYKLLQSNIDQALWTIVEDDGSQFLHEMKKVGYILTYVDDFVIVAEKSLRRQFEEEISRHWKIKVTGSIDQDGSERVLTYLSTEIRTTSSGGFFLDQEKFTNDLLKTWEHANCKSSSTPGEKNTCAGTNESGGD